MFVLTTGISIAYYVTFRTYHTALSKMESLKKLLANPNARVASGDTGKSILKRLKADHKKTETPKQIVKTNKANETVDLLKQLIEARKTEKEEEHDEPLLSAPHHHYHHEAPRKTEHNSTLEMIKKTLADRKAKNMVPQNPVGAELLPLQPQQQQSAFYQMPPVG